jgi:hypothetical protein
MNDSDGAGMRAYACFGGGDKVSSLKQKEELRCPERPDYERHHP